MAMLRIQPPDRDEQTLDLDAPEVTLGRAADNTLVLDDPAASSHHCVIVCDASRYTLRDLDSTNGTLLNGAPVRESRLSSGDIVTVGSVRITIEGDDVEPASEPFVPAVGPGHTARMPTTSATPPEFGVRPRRTGLFVTLAVVIVIGLTVLVLWFVKSLTG